MSRTAYLALSKKHYPAVKYARKTWTWSVRENGRTEAAEIRIGVPSDGDLRNSEMH
jgi:hypothetical protein